MTDNIEKLYEIAGVEDIGKVESCSSEDYENCEYFWKFDCLKCEKAEKIQPPFTAEKQLELIKWLMQYKQTLLIELQYFEGDCCITHCTECKDNDTFEYVRTGRAKLLENALADLFIDMWQDLTDGQKQEIKRILE